MTQPDPLIQLARRWLACFDHKNVDELVALYAQDARHTSPKLRASRPETGGHIVGREALRDWWADAFRRMPNLRYVERTLTSDGQRVWMEYIRFALADPDLPVAEVLEVRDGLIVESRVYHG